jgi:hypothetical protein
MSGQKHDGQRVYADTSLMPAGNPTRFVVGSRSASLMRALHQLDGFSAADAALHRWAAVADEYASSVKLDVDPVGELVESFSAGRAVKASAFVEAAEQVHVAGLGAAAANGLVREVGQRLWTARDQIIVENPGPLAESLTADLHELVDGLRKSKITVLDADPATVLASGRAAEHRQLTVAIESYNDLRVGIAATLNTAGHLGGDGSFWVAALVVDPFAVDPMYGVRAANVNARNVKTGEVVDHSVHPIPFDGEDRAEELAWMVENLEHHVRVATPREFEATIAAMRSARSAAADAAKSGLRVRVTRSAGFYGPQVHRDLEAGPRRPLAILRDGDPDDAGEDVWEISQPVSAYA